MSDGKFVYCGDVKMLHRSFGAKSVCFHLDMKEAQRLRDGLDEAISLRRRYERQQKKPKYAKQSNKTNTHVDKVNSVILTYHINDGIRNKEHLTINACNKDSCPDINLLPGFRKVG